LLPGRKPRDADGEPSSRGAAALAAVAPVGVEGALFGAYRLEACIGQSGSSRLYRAEHQGLKRCVALKVLLDRNGTPSKNQERLLQEARVAASIKHPNIVNIYDVGVHAGTPYLVMELLEGSSLSSVLSERGRLDEGSIIDIAIPLASALATVHDAGMAHCDLGPANIFLSRTADDQLQPRLLDIAISKALGHAWSTVSGVTVAKFGSPVYLSPEVAGGGKASVLTDQYSLGILLYECATGVNPFASASNAGDVIRRVLAGSVEPVPMRNGEISRRLIGIIERAMHVDPARRFPDMRALGRELLMLAGQRTRITWGLSFGGPVAGTDPSDLSHSENSMEPPRPRSRRRILYAAVSTLAVALCVGLWNYGDEPSASPRASLGSPAAAGDPGIERRGYAALPTPSADPTDVAAPPGTPEPVAAPTPVAPAPVAPASLEQQPVTQGAGARRAAAQPGASEPASAARDPGHETSTVQPVSPPRDARGVSARAVAEPRPTRARVAVRHVVKKPAVEPVAQAPSEKEDAPDWMVMAPPTPSATDQPRGTNDAPILD
jgi:serine/threonine protein kinase